MGDQDSSTGAHPDEDPHTYCVPGSVLNDAVGNIDNAEWNALDPTEVNVNFDSFCDLDGSTETDVVWQTVNLEDNVYGRVSCDDYEVIGDQCDQNYAKLDIPEIDEGSNDEKHQTMVACHELGHTAGLSHGDTNDCMEDPVADTPPLDQQYRRYNSHHIDHLNAWF